MRKLWKLAIVAILLYLRTFAAFAQSGTIVEFEKGFALKVDDPRPLAAAVQTLVNHYAWQVSYEDPPYTYWGDVEDRATPDYRRKYPEAAAGWVPKGGPFDFRFEWPADLARTKEPLPALQALIERYNESSLPGIFEVRQVSAAFHVVPVQARNENGEWSSVTPLLDSPVSFPEEERTISATLEAISQQMFSASGRGLRLGAVPLNLMQSRATISASGQPAYEVIQELLDATGRKMVWLLLRGPRRNDGRFNFRVISP